MTPQNSLSPPEKEILVYFEKLLEASQSLLTATHQGDVAEITRLLTDREHLLEKAQKSPLENMSPGCRAKVQQIFAQINTLEPEILQRLNHARDHLESSLRELKESRQVISHYKIEPDELTGGYTTDA